MINLILLILVLIAQTTAHLNNILATLKSSDPNIKEKQITLTAADSINAQIENYDGVSIKNQNIPKLETNAICNLSIIHLNLIQDKIRTIEPGAFKNLPNLHELDLSGNLLEEIKNGIFENVSFETLYLNNNRIVKIGGSVFQRLTMKFLFIDDNRISEWKSEWFFGTPLAAISMGNNYLANLPRNSFEYLWQFKFKNYHLNTLDYLILNGNKLKELDPDAFLGLDEIITLNLRDNSLVFLPPGVFDSVQEIDFIDLSENKINELHYESFRNTKIDHLNLQNNLLDCISNEIFNVTGLKRLKIDNNPISCVCIRQWNEWKMGSDIPEIDNFIELEKRCKSASYRINFIKLFILLCIFVLFVV